MKAVIGVACYLGAWAVLFLGIFFHVPVALWCVSLFLAVVGGLVAWAGPPATQPVAEPQRVRRGRATPPRASDEADPGSPFGMR